MGFKGLVQPFIMKSLIDFIKGSVSGEEAEAVVWFELNYGLFLVFLFSINSINEAAETYLTCQKDILNTTDCDKAKNLIRIVIFEKFQSISEATNKDLEEGELLDLITKDAQKVEELFGMVQDLSKLPVSLCLSFCMLYYYFGLSFLASLIAFLVYLLINRALAHKRNSFQIEMEKRAD